MRRADGFAWMCCLGTALLAGSTPGRAQPAAAQVLAQGGYVALAADCAACHTAPAGEPNAGGLIFRLPAGEIVSPNITPSRSHGIGGWSEAQFARALRQGVRPDGTHLTPTMPYPEYAGIGDADMHALYLYYQNAVAPVDAAPAAHTRLAFPLNVPGVMQVWDALYLKSHPATAVGGPTAAVERGRYLAEALGHCGACHTPRNGLLAETTPYLSGGFADGWYAPNLTADPVSGLGAWSDAELTQYLRTGRATGKEQAAGPMADVVDLSLSKLKDEDIAALVAYLRTVPAVRTSGQTLPAWGVTEARAIAWTDFENPIPGASTPARYDIHVTDGALLYNVTCASCHGIHGEGAADGSSPPLLHNAAVGGSLPNNLVLAILHGMRRTDAKGIYVMMPAYAAGTGHNDATFTPDSVAALANYVTDKFGRGNAGLRAADVARIAAGGETPFLFRYAAWLAAGAVIVVLAAALGLRALRRSEP